MLDLLWLVPALPLLGFLLLFTTRGQLGRSAIAAIGTGSVGLAALLTIGIGLDFLSSPPPGHAHTQTLWTWIDVGGLNPGVAFYLDALSLVMIFVITFVGTLIHWYSTAFMAEDEGYNRFFAYMNLFVASMLILVLADNLLFLFLGWEGVGLCSYLLIGFWYQDPENGAAARKAFVITRAGDVAMVVGLLLLFTHLNTLDIQLLLQRASANWAVGSGLAIAAAALLLGGALGKSAQLPLQTWLPDAMAGPTPVSALIHAATMVTAGVYLVARMHALYALAPPVQLAIAIIGALTLLLAGFSALTQWDIKRVLAYSTISQIGYMFLANGVGAWSAAIFHFMTHAFFKALLFLSAGVVINALHHEHNIFRMGGLRRELPIAFWSFLIGAAALSAVPLITAGFYSKDLILWQAWSSPGGSPWLWAAGLLGALLTSLYTFRVVFIAFFGEAQTPVTQRPPMPMVVPLIVLSALSLGAGLLQTPPLLGDISLLGEFLHTALPPLPETHPGLALELTLVLVAVVTSLGGIYAAYRLFLNPRTTDPLFHTWTTRKLYRVWFIGWGFDWVYDRIVVRPYVNAARANQDDFVDTFYDWIAWLNRLAYQAFSWTQSGQLRRYAAAIGLGFVVLGGIVVLA